MTLYLELASFLEDAGKADPALAARARALRLDLTFAEVLSRDPAQDRSPSGRGSRPSSAGGGAEPLVPALLDWPSARVVCSRCGNVSELRDTPELLDFVSCAKCRKPGQVQNLRRKAALGVYGPPSSWPMQEVRYARAGGAA